jgi:hypothetical protein
MIKPRTLDAATTAATLWLLGLLLALSPRAAHGQSRTWTSASDPSKQFEGELVTSEAGRITVRRTDGTQLTFALDVLSQKDQDYVSEQQASLPTGTENTVYQELSSNLVRGSISPRSEYYIIYAAASF